MNVDFQHWHQYSTHRLWQLTADISNTYVIAVITHRGVSAVKDELPRYHNYFLAYQLGRSKLIKRDALIYVLHNTSVRLCRDHVKCSAHRHSRGNRRNVASLAVSIITIQVWSYHLTHTWTGVEHKKLDCQWRRQSEYYLDEMQPSYKQTRPCQSICVAFTQQSSLFQH